MTAQNDQQPQENPQPDIYAPIPIVPEKGLFGTRSLGTYHRYPFVLDRVDALTLNEVDYVEEFIKLVHELDQDDYDKRMKKYNDPFFPDKKFDPASLALQKLAVWIYFYMYGVPAQYEEPEFNFSEEEKTQTKEINLLLTNESNVSYTEGLIRSWPFTTHSIVRVRYDLVQKWLKVAARKAKDLFDFRDRKIGDIYCAL